MTTLLAPADLTLDTTFEDNTVHLQSVGRVPGILASQLRVGNILMWNFGGTYEIVAIRNKSPQFIEVDERDTADRAAKIYTRRLKKTRLTPLSPLLRHRENNPQVTAVLATLRAAGVRIEE